MQANQQGNQIPEVRIAEGVYFTDYRKPQPETNTNNCMKAALNSKFFRQIISFNIKNFH